MRQTWWKHTVGQKVSLWALVSAVSSECDWHKAKYTIVLEQHFLPPFKMTNAFDKEKYMALDSVAHIDVSCATWNVLGYLRHCCCTVRFCLWVYGIPVPSGAAAEGQA